MPVTGLGIEAQSETSKAARPDRLWHKTHGKVRPMGTKCTESPLNVGKDRLNRAEMPESCSDIMSIYPLFSYTFPDRPLFLTSFGEGGWFGLV